MFEFWFGQRLRKKTITIQKCGFFGCEGLVAPRYFQQEPPPSVRSGSVDAVLCDLPFGRQHGSLEGNVALYPAVLPKDRRPITALQRGMEVRF